MNTHAFRKALVVFCVDLAIIIGIFVLQFRTDSTIIEKIGNLQVTLEKQENEENLQNKLEVRYNGLSFYSDDQNSAKIIYSGKSKVQSLKLLNYEKHEDRGFTFKFTDNVLLTFDVSGTDENAALSVYATLPDDVESFFIPYNFAYNMKIQKEDENRVVLNGKNATWAFTTNKIQDGFVYFSSSDAVAHYAVFDDTKKFSFDSLTQLAIADESVYSNTLAAFKGNLITSFKSALSSSNITESSTVAYVAAMAETGKYQQAIDEIPSSFKKSESRTYLSTPYFNNLAKMNTTLDNKLKLDEREITSAINSFTMDIFTNQNIASLLCIYPSSEGVKKLLNNAAAIDVNSCSLKQLTGLIQTYVELTNINSGYASILYPVIDKSINKIAASCNLENDTVIISENDQYISVMQAIETGVSIMRYGEISGQQTDVKAGRAIINSYMSSGSSFDLKTLAYLYPILCYDNWYYPHFKFINSDPEDLMWAWTCAKEITYKKDRESGLTLSIDFPQDQIHHVIFKGIPKFNAIYIYNIAYRTDPKFETYNSSGYVYKEEGYTLLLKSRHKSKIETVRMSYPDGIAPKKIISKPEGINLSGETTTPVTNAAASSNENEETETRETSTRASNSRTSNSRTSTESETEPSNTTSAPIPLRAEFEENDFSTTTAITSTTNTARKKYSVFLDDCPANKKKNVIAVIRSVRPDLSEEGAEKLYNDKPIKIISGLSSADADDVVSRIISAGGFASKKKDL